LQGGKINGPSLLHYRDKTAIMLEAEMPMRS
jgi:hypothetical protein